MNSRKFSEAMSELNSKYVDEAINYKKKSKNPVWPKWTIAACFAVAALVIGLFQSKLFGNRTDVATLDNGNKIVFVKCNTAGNSLSLDIDIDTKQLTEEETHSLFADLPVTAYAIYTKNSMDAGNSQNLIGFEGEIGTIKMIVSTSDIQLIDAVIAGKEQSTKINGTSITAGYFVTDSNSKGKQNAIYYSAFELGNCKIYLENSGTIENSETTKNQLAEVIQKIIENGKPDLTSFVDNEAGTDIDGNPDGYDPLPNSQTSDEEISEQDSAANDSK